MNRLMMTILTAMSTIAAQSAHAGVGDDSPRQSLVRFDDLDVTRPAGVSALYRRLQSTAHAVCEPLYARDPERVIAFRHFVADTTSRAVAQVDQPALTTYYRAALDTRNGTARKSIARR